MSKKTSTHQAEIDLLLHCAHSHLTPQQVECILELVRQDIDWAYVLEIADCHEITPLLYRSLQSSCPELVPPACLDKLRRECQEIAQHNFILTGQLIRLINLFAEHHIRAVPLKGPLLASLAYGDITLRQFSDLDILVHRDDIEQARDLLLSQGYRIVETKVAGHFENQKHDIGLIHNESQVHVELHREIAQKYYAISLNPDRLLQFVETSTLLGKAIPSMRLEDWLLTVCAHGTKHAWEQLKFVCDVGELVGSHQDIDWNTIIQTAQQTGNERGLLLGLYLAHWLLDVRVPQELSRQMEQNRLVKTLAEQVTRQLFRDTATSLGTVQLRLTHLRFQLQVQKGLRHKLRYLQYFIIYWLLIPGQSDRVVKLPGKLKILYSVFRPFRLLIRYGLGSFKHIWKRP